ncbi:MAG TPA: branched-chain amino acid aminotransferase [Thermodesulfobacteriota bacterium]|nr:branched-chain amino acid aminotransferase [Thermodesulfobacteriota bacterium]
MPQIPITKAEKLKQKPAPGTQLGFGKIFSDHLFLMNYEKGQGWKNPRIEPYRPLLLDPAALVLHYGQEVFEGLKAYRWANGEIHLFRPRMNYERMNRSARRLCMPEVDVDLVLDATRQLVQVEKEWVPGAPGSSLYIRPNMIATEPALGVQVSDQFLFYIMVGPVGAYYPQGFNPTDIYVSEKYVRAAKGGLGEAKTLANYAASLLAQEEAHEEGFTQVLWLDAKERKYVEEVGTSNIFLYIEDELVTPPLGGTILPGVTRDSALHIARALEMKVSERMISLDEILSALESGKVKEAFASGTAAVISPVGSLAYRGKKFVINNGKVGPLAQKLYDQIMGIQYGKIKDPYGWTMKVC